MLIKVGDLTGAALDWAVAVAENKNPALTSDMRVDGLPAMFADDEDDLWCPSIAWGQCGPLINKYGIGIAKLHEPTDGEVVAGKEWVALWIDDSCTAYGSTALLALCRVIVMHGIGNEVDIPDALVGG